ncbi:MAG: helix-turn-helix transcriptional regulator [Butyricicoccus pullicaecorum]|jgi:transcriptional regulator with XRE-family HTH domain|nr:helix-turn-helix transcriptional regulator [Butyricicoccus pullicaecorum]
MKLYVYGERCNIAGIRIRLLREKKRLSQEQLAAKLQLLGMEINQKAISRVETGARVVPDYELQFYAQALDTTIDHLLEQD